MRCGLAAFGIVLLGLLATAACLRPNQRGYGTHRQLGLPPERIHVIAPDIGGGFGPKNRYYHEYTLVPLMAMRLGRPVSWVEDRRESFTSTFHGREQDAGETRSECSGHNGMTAQVNSSMPRP